MKILVCGGREGYANVNKDLDCVHKTWPVTVVIQGGARGVDRQAYQWARSNKVAIDTFPADWDGQGKSAGVRRNQKMLEVGKPDMVVAFPGGKGTSDMVIRARKASIPVLSISETGWVL